MRLKKEWKERNAGIAKHNRTRWDARTLKIESKKLHLQASRLLLGKKGLDIDIEKLRAKACDIKDKGRMFFSQADELDIKIAEIQPLDGRKTLKCNRLVYQRKRLKNEGERQFLEAQRILSDIYLLRAEALLLDAENIRLRAEGDALKASSGKLSFDALDLRDTANEKWIEKILEVYGDITVSWEFTKQVTFAPELNCRLENGDLYVYNKE